MLRRTFVLAAAVALVAWMNPVRAEDAKEGGAKPGTHSGKVDKVDGNKLMMTGKDGSKHTHTIPADAKITCDGKACKLADLKPGQEVSVTAEKKGDKVVITKIEAKKS